MINASGARQLVKSGINLQKRIVEAYDKIEKKAIDGNYSLHIYDSTLVKSDKFIKQLKEDGYAVQAQLYKEINFDDKHAQPFLNISWREDND